MHYTFVCRQPVAINAILLNKYGERAHRTYRTRQHNEVLNIEVGDEFDIEAAEIDPLVPGFWRCLLNDVAEKTYVNCPPITTHGPLGWWHNVHGVNVVDSRRGSGLRIGVIDESLPPDVSLRHVERLGWIHRSKVYEDNQSFTSHGLAVCGLLTARIDGTDGFEGMAPGAEVIFVSARSQGYTRKIHPQSVAAGIRLLALERRCDIISVSAGDCETPRENIKEAVEDALDAGCICMFAAGNRSGPLQYPAKYKGVVAVTALGRIGLGPNGSMTRFHEMNSCAWRAGDLYAWECASGEGVGCIAAGVGLIMNNDGRSYTDVSGTSFATPVAAGVLAAALAADKTYLNLQGHARAMYAMRKLRRICASDVFPPRFSGAGVPIMSRSRRGRIASPGAVGLSGLPQERTRLVDLPERKSS